MALLLATPQLTIMKTFLPSEKRSLSHATWNSNVARPTKCKAKFQPSIWTDNYIQSLNSEYKVQLFILFDSKVQLFIDKQ
jgi:hypothetical protein